jgi:ferric-dicitrate binding protein FerR (iron transport regulator)
VDINGKDSAVVLGAGQIATCTGGMFPGSPEAILFSEYPGWMHGKFMFYRRDLVSACKEIESQFDVKIRMESLPNETMTGVVDGRNAETALATLAKLTGKKYRHENSTYILY